MRPALLQERGIKMTTTNRTSRTRRKRNTGTLNVKINACQECGNKKPLLKVDKNFFHQMRKLWQGFVWKHTRWHIGDC